MSEFPLETDCQTVHQLRTAGAEFLLLDCREADEFAIAHIDGAMLLPMSDLEARRVELDKHADSHIVVHCHHGMRSLRVAKWLREQGFAKTQSMAGGIDAWSEEIDPSVPRY